MAMLKGWTLNVELLNHFLPPPLYLSTSLSVCGKQHVSVCDHVVPPLCAGLWPNKLMLSWGLPLGVPGLCHLDPTATSSPPNLAVWGGVDPTATLSSATVFVQPYSHVVTPNLAIQGGVDPTTTLFDVIWTPKLCRHSPPCSTSPTAMLLPNLAIWCCLNPTATSSLAAAFVQPYSHVVIPNLAIRGGVDPTATSFIVIWTPQLCHHLPPRSFSPIAMLL